MQTSHKVKNVYTYIISRKHCCGPFWLLQQFPNECNVKPCSQYTYVLRTYSLETFTIIWVALHHSMQSSHYHTLWLQVVQNARNVTSVLRKCAWVLLPTPTGVAHVKLGICKLVHLHVVMPSGKYQDTSSVNHLLCFNLYVLNEEWISLVFCFS